MQELNVAHPGARPKSSFSQSHDPSLAVFSLYTVLPWPLKLQLQFILQLVQYSGFFITGAEKLLLSLHTEQQLKSSDLAFSD